MVSFLLFPSITASDSHVVDCREEGVSAGKPRCRAAGHGEDVGVALRGSSAVTRLG